MSQGVPYKFRSKLNKNQYRMMSWTPTSFSIILNYVLTNTHICALGTGFKLV
jgi:hypothetical protein